MIRRMRGKVLEISVAGIVMETAGFGIFIYTPTTVGLKEGEEATLATYLAVRQDGLELYGFVDALDRDFFEKLLLVPGVGPKTALSILRRSPRESLESAIARRDINYLTRVAGLGKKSAEKLAVELAEKLAGKMLGSEGDDTEVFDTLVALGYTEREARHSVQRIPEEIKGKEARLRAALSAK